MLLALWQGTPPASDHDTACAQAGTRPLPLSTDLPPHAPARPSTQSADQRLL
jgi:hypothetical protein